MSIVVSHSSIEHFQYPENFSEMNAELYLKMYTEFEHIHKRCDDLAKENAELMQKTQVVVKKVETNIVETKPGMDEEAVKKITELESRLSQAEIELSLKLKEIEDLQKIASLVPGLESRIVLLEEENKTLKFDLSESLKQLDIIGREKVKLEEQLEKNALALSEKNKEIEDMLARIQELEVLSCQLAKVQKDIEVLQAEVARLTSLIKEKDVEIAKYITVIETLRAEKCPAPVEHDELKIKIIEVNELREKLAAIPILQETILELKAENKKLLESLAAMEDANQQLRMKVEELIKTIDRLNDEIGVKDITITELEKQKSQVIVQIEQIRVESDERLKIVIAEKDLEIAALNQKLALLTREIEILKAEFDALKMTYDQLILERDNLLKILSTRDSQISALTAELATAREQITKFTAEFDVSAAKISALEVMITDYTTQIGLLEKEKQSLLIKIAELEELKPLLEKVTLERNTKVVEVQELTLLNTGLIGDVKVLQDELNALRIKFEEIQVHLDKVTFERDEKLEDIRSLIIKNEQLVLQVSRLEADLRDRDALIQELTLKQQELMTKVASLTESITILQHDRDDLALKYEATKSENLRLLKTVEELTAEKEHFLTLIEQRDNLTAALNKDIVRLTQENKDLIAKLALLQEQYDALSALLQEREIEITKLKAMVDKIFPEMDAMKDKLKYYSSEFDRLDNLNKVQDQELISLREQLLKVDEYKSRMEELALENAELRRQLEELERVRAELIRVQQQLSIVISERDKLINALRDREEEIKNLKFVAREFEELRVRYNGAEIEISKLRDLLAQRELYIRELEAKIVDLEAMIERQKYLQADNERLSGEITSLKSRCQTLEYTVTVSNEKYKKLENLYLEIKGATEHLGAVHDKLVETVEETEKVNESLKTTEVYQQKIVSEKLVEEHIPQRF